MSTNEAARCPFPGLAPYTEEDHHRFHGRREEIKLLANKLRNQRELYLIGPSGSGKTSLVRAGLIPELRRRLSVEYLTPDIGGLERAVRMLVSGTETLLVIDRLEALFHPAFEERDAFLEALNTLRSLTQCKLLFVLRADFLGELMSSPLWQHAKDTQMQLPPLQGDALRDALRSTNSLEPALLERLIADCQEAPGAMPLLQDLLVTLWKDNPGTTSLTREQYLAHTSGRGLSGALEHRADGAWAALTESQQKLARRWFLRLVHPGQGRAHTRYQRRWAELIDGEAPDHARVLRDVLISKRLLVASETHGETRIDLAHERLIDAWPRLRTWIEEFMADETTRGKLEARAREHRAAEADLLSERDLAAAEEWRDRAVETVGCSELLARYLGQSRAKLDSDAQRAALAQARQYLTQAQSHLRGARGAKAAPYLVAARELLDKHGALTLPERLLFGWAKRSLPIAPSWLPLRWDTSVKGDLTSPNGAYVARVDADGLTLRVHIAAPAPREPQRPKDTPSSSSPLLELPTQITHLVWSDDSRYLAVRCGVQDFVFDAIDPKEPPADRANGVAPAPLPSPRNDRLATANGKLVRITAAGAARSPDLDHKEQVVALAWSPCSTCLATATDNRTIRIWDATMGYQVQRDLVATGPVRKLEWTAEHALRITTEEHSYERTLDPTDLADWRAAADKSPYHLVEGVLLRKEPTRP